MMTAPNIPATIVHWPGSKDGTNMPRRNSAPSGPESATARIQKPDRQGGFLMKSEVLIFFGLRNVSRIDILGTKKPSHLKFRCQGLGKRENMTQTSRGEKNAQGKEGVKKFISNGREMNTQNPLFAANLTLNKEYSRHNRDQDHKQVFQVLDAPRKHEQNKKGVESWGGMLGDPRERKQPKPVRRHPSQIGIPNKRDSPMLDPITAYGEYSWIGGTKKRRET